LHDTRRAARSPLYDFTMYILCGMLVIGLICNFLIKPDGFMKWAWSSEAAFKRGRFFKTSGSPLEMPPLSCVGRAKFNEEVRAGVEQPAGVWFEEPVKEFSVRSEIYDLNYTLLHLESAVAHVDLVEPHVPDTYDRFA
jgi:hypothetical protein